jgi:hypothetical protein
MERRFPEAAERGKVRPEDIEKLKNDFHTIVEPVIDDRDVHRAHPFEKGDKATMAALRVDEMCPVFDAVQSLLNDLRLICDDSTRSYHDHLLSADADDLADLVLFGSRGCIASLLGSAEAVYEKTGKWEWQHREELYENLHRAHESLAADAVLNAKAVLALLRDDDPK